MLSYCLLDVLLPPGVSFFLDPPELSNVTRSAMKTHACAARPLFCCSRRDVLDQAATGTGKTPLRLPMLRD